MGSRAFRPDVWRMWTDWLFHCRSIHKHKENRSNTEHTDVQLIMLIAAGNLSACVTYPRLCNAFSWPFASEFGHAHCSKLWDMSRTCPLPISMAGPLLPFEALSGHFLSIERVSSVSLAKPSLAAQCCCSTVPPRFPGVLTTVLRLAAELRTGSSVQGLRGTGETVHMAFC